MTQPTESEKISKHGITFDEAKKLVRNYVKTVARGTNGRPTETLSVWFGIQQLRDILGYLEEELINSTPERQTDGIRIYFGNYGDIPPTDNPEFAYKNTLVFISTYTDSKIPHKHIDYFNYEVPFLPENRGKLCPPDKGCDCNSPLLDPEDQPDCTYTATE